MDEHDDDLESEVHEEAEEETATFPNTADDLDGPIVSADDDDPLDDDPAEL